MNKIIYKGKDVIVINCDNVNICSVYIFPQTERHEYVVFLKALELVIERSKNKDMIIAEDFNSRHISWDKANN